MQGWADVRPATPDELANAYVCGACRAQIGRWAEEATGPED